MTTRILPFFPGRNRPDRAGFASGASWRRTAAESARANMADFVIHAKERSWFLQREDGPKWNDMKWEFDGVRGPHTKRICTFNTIPGSNAPMPEPFAEQSRAIVAEVYRRKPGIDPGMTVRALRLLFQAMSESGRAPDLVHLDQVTVDCLDARISSQVTKTVRWRIAIRLEEIVNDILSENNLTMHPLSYGTSFRFADTTSTDNHIIRAHKCGADGSSSETKLPNLQAVLELAKLFNEPGHAVRDLNLVVSAFAALSLFGPARVSEILTLPVNCTTVVDDGNRQKMGLLVRPVKGGLPIPKFAVTPEWAEVATVAVRCLTAFGEGARTAAQWYADNPGRLYLPPGTEHLRGKPLTRRDVVRITGYEPGAGPGFRIADLMLKSLRPVRKNREEEEALYSQASVRAFIKRHIDEYPGYVPKRLRKVRDWLESETMDFTVDGATAIKPGRPLTIGESLSIIGLSKRDLALPQLPGGLTVKLKKSDRHLYEFDSLEEWVLQRLPDTLPIVDPLTGLKFSEALFCLPKNILNAARGTFWNIPAWISPNDINLSVSSSKKSLSVFRLNRILDPQTGKPCKLTSHQFRHLLNTMAQRGYIPQSLIAAWSGRRDIEQNKAYNHVGQEPVLKEWQMLSDPMQGKVRIVGPLHERNVRRSVEGAVSYRQALELDLGAAHATRYGICLHHYALGTCPHSLDCVSCSENMLVAHDERMIAEAHAQVAIHRKAADRCRKAIQEGKPGVERWLKQHLKKLDRWEAAIKLLTDENTEPGTTVALPPDPDVRTAAEFAMNSRFRGNETAGGKNPGSMEKQNQQKRKQ